VGEDGAVHQHVQPLGSTEQPVGCTQPDVRDLETSWALDIHEERVGLGHNLLELVGSGLNLSGSV
jgi:hypothetical protein